MSFISLSIPSSVSYPQDLIRLSSVSESSYGYYLSGLVCIYRARREIGISEVSNRDIKMDKLRISSTIELIVSLPWYGD